MFIKFVKERHILRSIKCNACESIQFTFEIFWFWGICNEIKRNIFITVRYEAFLARMSKKEHIYSCSK
jgi:hypothetical protein